MKGIIKLINISPEHIPISNNRYFYYSDSQRKRLCAPGDNIAKEDFSVNKTNYSTFEDNISTLQILVIDYKSKDCKNDSSNCMRCQFTDQIMNCNEQLPLQQSDYFKVVRDKLFDKEVDFYFIGASEEPPTEVGIEIKNILYTEEEVESIAQLCWRNGYSDNVNGKQLNQELFKEFFNKHKKINNT